MTIPLDAIDPEAGYREWVKQYLWHIDQIPALVEAIGQMATPTIRASQTDKVVVSGGNYRDFVPVGDEGAVTDLDRLWADTREYVLRVSDVAGRCPVAGTEPALWGGRDRGSQNPAATRTAAYTATSFLADLVEHVVDWPELSALEDFLFSDIRRLRGRYRNTSTRRRARPRLCETCGEHAVIVDWVDAANGSPKPVQVGVCRSCGEQYTTTTENTDQGD